MDDADDLREDCLNVNPCVACCSGDGRNINVFGRAGRFAAGEDEIVKLEELLSLFSFSSLSSGICCSAGLYMCKSVRSMQ